MPSLIKEADTLSFWRFSVEQYHQMIQTGILDDDTPVELLNGWLISKMSQGPYHRAVLRQLRDALEPLVQTTPGTWYVETQCPVTLTDSEPEPDIAVIRGTNLDYLHQHPQASDLALVVEISDSSLRRDQGLKQRIYAQAGIPTYWIVNLAARRLERHTNPQLEVSSYADITVYTAEQRVPVVINSEVIGELALSTLFP